MVVDIEMTVEHILSTCTYYIREGHIFHTGFVIANDGWSLCINQKKYRDLLQSHMTKLDQRFCNYFSRRVIISIVHFDLYT